MRSKIFSTGKYLLDTNIKQKIFNNLSLYDLVNKHSIAGDIIMASGINVTDHDVLYFSDNSEQSFSSDSVSSEDSVGQNKLKRKTITTKKRTSNKKYDKYEMDETPSASPPPPPLPKKTPPPQKKTPPPPQENEPSTHSPSVSPKPPKQKNNLSDVFKINDDQINRNDQNKTKEHKKPPNIHIVRNVTDISFDIENHNDFQSEKMKFDFSNEYKNQDAELKNLQNEIKELKIKLKNKSTKPPTQHFTSEKLGIIDKPNQKPKLTIETVEHSDIKRETQPQPPTQHFTSEKLGIIQEPNKKPQLTIDTIENSSIQPQAQPPELPTENDQALATLKTQYRNLETNNQNLNNNLLEFQNKTQTLEQQKINLQNQTTQLQQTNQTLQQRSQGYLNQLQRLDNYFRPIYATVLPNQPIPQNSEQMMTTLNRELMTRLMNLLNRIQHLQQNQNVPQNDTQIRQLHTQIQNLQTALNNARANQSSQPSSLPQPQPQQRPQLTMDTMESVAIQPQQPQQLPSQPQPQPQQPSQPRPNLEIQKVDEFSIQSPYNQKQQLNSLNRQVNQLKQEKAQLESQINSDSSISAQSIQALQNTIQNLQNEKNDLLNQNNNAMNLQNENQRLQQQLQTLKERVENVGNPNDQKLQQMAQFHESYKKQMEKDLMERNMKVVQTIQEKTAVESKKRELEKEIFQLKENLEKMKKNQNKKTSPPTQRMYPDLSKRDTMDDKDKQIQALVKNNNEYLKEIEWLKHELKRKTENWEVLIKSQTKETKNTKKEKDTGTTEFIEGNNESKKRFAEKQLPQHKKLKTVKPSDLWKNTENELNSNLPPSLKHKAGQVKENVERANLEIENKLWDRHRDRTKFVHPHSNVGRISIASRRHSPTGSMRSSESGTSNAQKRKERRQRVSDLLKDKEKEKDKDKDKKKGK